MRRLAASPTRTVTAQQAAALVRPGMWLDYGFAQAQPDAFDTALAEHAAELHDVKIRACLSLRPRAVLEADPAGQHFQWFSTFFSAYDRRQADQGRCTHLPVQLGEVPDYYRRFIDPPDILIIQARPVDEHGMFNFSTTQVWLRAIVERARIVIVETNAALPYVFGIENGVHISEVDFVIDAGSTPHVVLVNPAPTDVDRAVAHQIAAEVEDGACLQVGIGGMPNAVCGLLLEAGRRDLGIHTEMLTDGLIELYKTGAITGARKATHAGKIVFTFALGSPSLYETIDRNPDFMCIPVDQSNLPHMIMRNDNVMAINNTTQIDLQGQAASESDGHRHISGTGGQLQFVRGAYASKGGKSFICLSSTYERRGVRKSRIVLDLTQGNIVTTPRTDMMYVVTEYGMVNLKGKPVCDRARALISLAHPDFREDLEKQAKSHGIL
jgi:acyl-CoA hydrolase